jgi:hypothetical protein
MTNERQIGQAMIEEVLSGRNRSAPQANASTEMLRAAAHTLTQTVTRAVRHLTYIELVCEVPA